MNRDKGIHVIGVGSPHGDDAVGWETLAALKRVLGQRPNLEYHAVEGGQRLLELPVGAAWIIIDAALTEGGAGAIHRWEWPRVDWHMLRPGTTHDLGVVPALRLAETLDQLPNRVIVYGVEIEACAPQTGLSPGVAVALPELVGRLAAEVESLSP
jgi:hydrogenase maturation protease